MVEIVDSSVTFRIKVLNTGFDGGRESFSFFIRFLLFNERLSNYVRIFESEIDS